MSINVSLEVKRKAAASAAAKVFAAKYSTSPVSTPITEPLPGGNAYYDLLAYPSSVDNVEIITATFYYPTGNTVNATTPVYWYNSGNNTWTAWETRKRTISTTQVPFNGVTYGATCGCALIGKHQPCTEQPDRHAGSPEGHSRYKHHHYCVNHHVNGHRYYHHNDYQWRNNHG